MKGSPSKWNNETKILIKSLHQQLCINNTNWHQQKSDPELRASELLISALAQLINQGETDDIEQLLNQAIKWLKREIRDPGCPNKKNKNLAP